MPIALTEIQLFTNNAVALLQAPISASDTSLVVMTGYGNLFPQPSAPGEYFLITLEDQSASAREIIKVTGRSGDIFTGLVRGMEGTTPQNWSASLGSDTLVDHRITAETMQRTMQLPLPSTLGDLTDVSTAGAVNGSVLKYNGTSWVPSLDNTFVPGSINAFTDVDTTTTPPSVGQVLKWNGSNWVPATDNTGSGSGSSWINGENTLGTNIDPGWQLPISSTSYSGSNRTFKFLVTVMHSVSFSTRAFEIMLTISGNLSSNSETVAATQYATVGPVLLGDVHALLDTGAKVLNLEWENNESTAVTVHVTRVQHFPA